MKAANANLDEVASSASGVISSDVPTYETPVLTELGGVVELTNGTAADDTADMATAKYY